MSTDKILSSYEEMLSNAKAQPGVADVLKAYQFQAGYLQTYSVVSQVAQNVEQIKSAYSQNDR